MTFRSIILGLLGVMFIAAFGYVNDRVLKLESFNSGQFLAVLVYGGLMVTLAVVNPLLQAMRRRWALRPVELAAIVGILLVVVGIPGRGLTEQFTQILAMPAHWNKLSPGWRKNRVFDYVPAAAYPADAKYDREVQEDYIRGLGKPGEPIALGRVPWGKWRKCLTLWMPMVLLSGVSAVCLALIVHRQWSGNERLRYPIATFAESLLERDEGRAFATIFRSNAFWIGLGILLAIRGINGLNTWMRGEFIEIKLWFWFGQIGEKFTVLKNNILLWVEVHPIVIAFSFFLASEISLTLGLSQYVWAAVFIVATQSGVETRTHPELGGAMGWARAGAYVALGLTLLYIGRAHYREVLQSAVLRLRGACGDRAAVWACRFFLLALIGMVVILTRLGLAWPLSIALILLILLQFVCVSRIAAETGLFFIRADWQPVTVIFGLLGAYALGPQALFIMGAACMVLCACVSMALMPYMVHVLRITERAGLKPARVGWTSMGFYVVGVAIAVPATLWACYNFGSPSHPYYYRRLPSVPLQVADEAITELKLADQFEEAEGLGKLQRLLHVQPQRGFLGWAGAGFALVLLCAAMRLRFVWWPIHPVLFLVWATWPMTKLGHSFMIGWMLKSLVVRLGGKATYERVKPMMLGVVAGEMLSGVIFMAIGAVYYGITGLKPVVYTVFPR